MLRKLRFYFVILALFAMLVGCGGDGSPSVPIVVTPSATILLPNQTVQLSAFQAGTPNVFKWTATGGSIDSNGFYTAPSVPGVYNITARNVGGKSVTGSATVTVTSGEIYTFDFETEVGPEWSLTARDSTPTGRGFLGKFGSAAVAFSMSGLPSHTHLTISFDLYLISTWDGNDSTYGPDRWELRTPTSTILSTTFANIVSFNQSYPGIYPTDNFPWTTGAEEVDTLGYGLDSVYRLTFTIDHTDPTVDLIFEAIGLQPDLQDESWGLDNVVVSVSNGP